VDGSDVAAADMSCVWRIDGHDQAIGLRATGPELVVRMPMGEHSVMVTVRLADGRWGFAREAINVKDILIVMLGDSLATGEGNPEHPACWKGAENLVQETDPNRRGHQVIADRLYGRHAAGRASRR
jgi:hypothetical protein